MTSGSFSTNIFDQLKLALLPVSSERIPDRSSLSVVGLKSSKRSILPSRISDAVKATVSLPSPVMMVSLPELPYMLVELIV